MIFTGIAAAVAMVSGALTAIGITAVIGGIALSTVIAGALVGAAVGGLMAAVMGGEIGKGMLFGAVGGAVSAGFTSYATIDAGGVSAGTEIGSATAGLGAETTAAVTSQATNFSMLEPVATGATSAGPTVANAAILATDAAPTTNMLSGMLDKVPSNVAGGAVQGLGSYMQGKEVAAASVEAAGMNRDVNLSNIQAQRDIAANSLEEQRAARLAKELELVAARKRRETGITGTGLLAGA